MSYERIPTNWTNPPLYEITWAAGLFEGEGSVWLDSGERRHRQTRAHINMTDEEPIRRFHRIVGVGSVGVKGRLTKGGKAVYEWRTGNWAHVQHLFALFSRYLGPRRRAKFVEVLRAVNHEVPGSVRRAQCRNGHYLMKPEALYANGQCRLCGREKARRYYLRKKGAS